MRTKPNKHELKAISELFPYGLSTDSDIIHAVYYGHETEFFDKPEYFVGKEAAQQRCRELSDTDGYVDIELYELKFNFVENFY